MNNIVDFQYFVHLYLLYYKVIRRYMTSSVDAALFLKRVFVSLECPSVALVPQVV